MTRWELEYLLLFGPPENKLELIDGKTPCAFPFVDRVQADAHFTEWARTLSRWQGVADPPARWVDNTSVKQFGGFTLTQHRRPIRLEVPSEISAYHWAHGCFFDRSLWPGQPQGFESGFESPHEHSRIKLNLWSLFRDAAEAGVEGYGIGGVDISLTERNALQPDFFFYLGSKEQHLIGGQYFHGRPLLVMEVLSPFSRAIDRGPRKEIYRRAGVPQLWLIEPLTRTVELYQLSGGDYRLTETATIGQTLKVPDLGPLELPVDAIFQTGEDRPQSGVVQDERSGWAIQSDLIVGLQHLILLGHAERRREIWNNQSPCFLPFGSADEARHRLDRFIFEAARWEDQPPVAPVSIEPELDIATVGRFHFSRHGHIVQMNVDVEGQMYRSLLDLTANRGAWDWGDCLSA